MHFHIAWPAVRAVSPMQRPGLLAIDGQIAEIVEPGTTY